MADYILDGKFDAVNGQTSRQCIYNRGELTFNFDVPFVLDLTVWECKKIFPDNDNEEIRTIFQGEGHI